MNHVTHEYSTKMLDCGLIFFLWVSLHVLCVINITSLRYPVFPICHINSKQLLIKHYKPPPDFATQTTPEHITRLYQNKLLDYTRTKY